MLNYGNSMSRAQSWGRDLPVVRQLIRLSLTECEREVRGWPSLWEGEGRPWRQILSLLVGRLAWCR